MRFARWSVGPEPAAAHPTPAGREAGPVRDQPPAVGTRQDALSVAPACATW